MDSYNNVEQEIDLKDLMFAVLRRWRPIILIAMLFAALLGGYKLARGFQQLNDAKYVAEKAKENATKMEQYNASKKRLENEIENLKVSIENQQIYIEKSVLMSINPYDKYVSTADIYVTTDYQIMPGMTYQNINPTTSIIKSYMAVAQNGEMYNYVLSKMNNAMELRYLQEIVNVTPDYDNSMLNVTVYANNADDAKKIMKLVLGSMEEGQAEITAAIGEHTFSVLNQSDFATVDLSLDTEQKNQSKNLEQMETSLTTKTTELDGLKEPGSVLVSKRNIAKTAIKYILLGGVLGGFMMVFFICVGYLMSGKLANEKDLQRRFSMRPLGVFAPAEKRRLFAFVDRWIDKMEGTYGKFLSEEGTLEVIAANVVNYLGDTREVLLVGTVEAQIVENIQSRLSALLPGVALQVGGNICREANAIKKIASAEGIILIEERGRSTYSEIAQEIGTVTGLEKKIIGCIVL